MSFNAEERTKMLALKGVGEKVIQRLEELGFSELKQLETETAQNITELVAARLGTTCWKNSPQAKSAINSIIEFARSHSSQSTVI